MQHPESLIQYPCSFPVKVMGLNVPDLIPELKALALSTDPDFNPSSVELRPSKAGNYMGVTLTITATSRRQLDDFYRALTSHRLVKVVL